MSTYFLLLSNFVLKGTVFFKLFGFNRRPKLFLALAQSLPDRPLSGRSIYHLKGLCGPREAVEVVSTAAATDLSLQIRHLSTKRGQHGVST